MKKEKLSPISQYPASVKQLESLKFVFRGRQDDLEDGNTYEWLGDRVIRKTASVIFGKDAVGKDTATIKMQNPETNKEEVVYYTADEIQVARLKGLSENRTIKLDFSEQDIKEDIETDE